MQTNTTTLRMRVPKALIEVLNRKEVKKKAITEAEKQTLKALFQYGATVFEQSGVLIKELESYVIYNNVTVTAPILENVVQLYLEKSEGEVTHIEFKNRRDFFVTLLPQMFSYFNIPTDLTKLKPTHLRMLSECLKGLPNRNLKENRDKPLKSLLATKDKTPISLTTTNKLIKRIRSLLTFTSSYFGTPMPSIDTYKLPHNIGNRESFSREEINALLSTLNEGDSLLLKVVSLSGMRSSEIPKSTIHMVDGVLCFDLRNAKGLKTKSSYRVIPVHIGLIPYIEDINALTYSTIKSRARRVHLNGKTLYSARHYFITALINKKVPPHIVSELAGHSKGNSMTLNTYFKGTELVELRNVVNMLS